MGLFDYSYLSFFGVTLVISSILLFISLRSTEDEKKKSNYKKTYTPFITLSIAMLILYVGILSIGNVALDLMQN